MRYDDLIQIYLENKNMNKEKALEAIDEMKVIEANDNQFLGRHNF